ncbi:BnaCnng09280D [Brassica napus]|uniref:BnaCnng09280D protein n=1 Tax=Brassica napus TaxID=3708 RepID=A0A078HQF0_BRANA|nr:BnaCnng09280D [Brassica napus]
MWLFSASITRLNSLNKRTRDVIASSLYSIIFDSTSN